MHPGYSSKRSQPLTAAQRRRRHSRRRFQWLWLVAALFACTLLASSSLSRPASAQVPLVPANLASGPTVPIIVKFKAGATAADIDAAEKASGGQKARQFDKLRTHVLNVPAAARDSVIAALAKHAAVERVNAAVKLSKAGSPDDTGYPQQWALPRIAWDQAYGSVAIAGTANLAVLDTGIESSHPDLAGRVITATSTIGGDPLADNSDPNGHGTALAGIAAANTNNGIGMAGVAWTGVNLMSAQVLQADGTGYDSDIIAGVMWAADNGANVILMGFSSPDYSPALADALAYAWGKGVVLVAATGNAGSTAATYPAGMPNVLGVAATDQNDAVGANSNTGSALVAAPGVGIYATLRGGAYGNVSGTSAASGEVAGLAALLAANGKSNQYIFDQVRGATDPVAGAAFGRLNVAKALGAQVTPAPTATGTPAPTPTPGATPTYSAGAGSLTLNPTSGAVGTSVTVTSGGGPFDKGVSNIGIYWDGTINTTNGTLLTTCSTNGNSGNLNTTPACTFTVPASATGPHNVVATQQNKTSDSVQATFNVLASTSLTVNAASGTYGGTTNLLATLTSGSSGVSGKTISFTLNGGSVCGGSGQPACPTTNASGVATISNIHLTSDGTATGTRINANTYATGVGASFAGDPSFAASSGTAQLTVSQAAVTASVTASNKTYDGTATATISTCTLSGVFSGDTVTCSAASASFANKNVGTGKTVTAIGIALSGAQADNYTLSSTTATTTANITARAITVTAVTNTKTYDATTSAAATPTFSPALAGTDTPSFTETYDTKNVGTSKTLTPSGIVNDGNNGNNYTYTFVASTNGVINKAPLTITAATNTKTYDATTSAAATPTTSGLQGSDTVTGLSESYDTKNVGTGKTLTVNVGFSVNDGNSGNNYTVTTATNTTGVINKAPLTVTADNQSRAYGDPNPTLTASYAGFVGGETLATSGVTGSPSLATTATAASPVGAYAITAAVGTLASANYSFSFVSGTLTVNKAVLTVTADNKSKTYGDANPAFTASYSGFKNGETLATSGVSGSPSLTTSANASSGVGSYTITAALGTLAASNYSFSFVNGTLMINPALLTVTADNKSKVYGDANPALTASYSGFVNGDTSSVLSGSPNLSTAATTGSSVGSYAITAVVGTLATANYTVTFVNGTLTVSPATLTVTADDKTKTYGQANPTLTARFTGFKNGETLATSGVIGAPSLSTSADASSAVGSYAITAAAGTLAATNYSFAFVNGTLTVTPAVLTVTADNKSKVYGDPNPVLTASYSDFVNGDTATVLSGSPSLATTAVTGSPVGAYSISAAVGTLSAANYSFAFVNGTLTVTPATLTVTADDKTKIYGAANPPLSASYTGFKNGDTASMLTGSPSLNTTATQASGVGSYPITVAQGTLAAANYAFSFVNGTLQVTPATLTVTGADASRAYGDANPTFTASYAGFVNGDTSSVVSGSASCSTTARATSPVGAYSITCSQGTLAAANYTFTFAAGTLTVNKAVLTVTANDASREYGDANPTFTASYSGFKNGETLATGGVTGSPSLTTAATASSLAGAYAITAASGSLAAGNYSFSFVNGMLTVTKATLTVTADDKSRQYGDANPSFTASYGGFKNGETLVTSGVTGASSLTTSATAASAVPGPYAITASLGTLAAGNYDFTFVNGSLTITKAALTVTANNKSREYGAANPSFDATITGFKNAETLASSGVTGSPVCSTSVTAASPVPGPYTITCALGSLASGNYSFSFVDGTLTITKAPLSITADDKSKVYGDANPTLTGSIVGLKNGDGIGASYSTAATTASPVGTYAIVPAAVDTSPSTLGNYDVTLVNGTLTISKAPLTITADDKTKTYGDANPTLTGVIAGVKNGDGITANYSTVANATSGVGPYAIVPAAVDSTPATLSNYDVTLLNGTLTVNQRPVTVTADSQSKKYGDTDPALTYKITAGNLVNGDTFTGALTRDAGENVGQYNIKQGTLVLSSNYALSFTGDKLTITKRSVTITADAKSKTYGDADPALTYQVTSGSLVGTDSFSGALTRAAGENVGAYAIQQGSVVLSANYNLSYVGANLNITARPIQITADAKSKVYGDSDPALTYQITSGSLAFSDAFTGGLTRDSGENVGAYTITQGTLALNSNYTLSYVGAKLTITPRPVSITADAKTKTYGDADPVLTYKITSGTLAFSDAFTGSLDRDPGENVGAYNITQGSVALNSNYSLTYVGASLTIGKATLTVTADDKSRAYGDANPTFTASYSGFKFSETLATSGVTGSPALSTTADGTSPVGNYTITAAKGTLAASNYDFAFVNGNLAVTKRLVTVTADPQTKTYGDVDPTLSYHISSGSLVNGDTFSGALTRDAGENVGAYATKQGTLVLSTNYDLTFVGANLTIGKATLTVTANDASRTYGDANPTFTASFSGFKFGQTLGTSGVTGAPSLTTAATAVSSVGNYAITAALGTLAASNYHFTFVEGSLTITSRAVTVTADPQSKTYGNGDPAFSYQITSGSLVNGDMFGGALTRDAGEAVGTYSILKGTLTLSDNYTLSYVGANLTINPRPVTITADAKTKTYGDGDPALSYQITVGSLAFSDAFTGALSRVAGEDVGSYAINQGSVALSANYTLSFVGANLTIGKRSVTITADAQTKTYGDADPTLMYHISSGTLAFSDAFTGSLTRVAGESVGTYAIQQETVALSSNYALIYAGADFTITKRAVTITADAKSKTYGDTDPALTYQISSGSLAFSDTFGGSLSRAAGESVGSYAINQGSVALNDNYTLTYVGANLTIEKRSVTIKADAKSKTYGASDPTLTYQITKGSLAFSDNFNGSLTRAAGENVGTYTIQQGSVALSGNYDLTYVGADLTIGQRSVTITADPQTKTYGNADPALTFQITSGSLVTGDSFTGSLTRVAGENVGQYDIQQGTVALSTNYALTYVGGKLSINPRAVTITADAKSKTYGDSDPALTYKITAGTLAFSDAFTGALTRDAGEDVGSYAITQGTVALTSDYVLSYVGANLMITKRAVTVTADPQSKVYGDSDPALTYKITTGSLAFSDAFTGALARAAGEDVGSYAIGQGTLALNTNYDLTYVGANLTVTVRLVTITADAKSKTYGEANPALTYQITKGSLAFSDAFTGSLTRDAGENVGSYVIQQGTVALSTNYALSYVGASLIITARPITVKADAKNKVYGDADPALTFQISSGSLAFSDAFTGALARDPGQNVGQYNITQGSLALNSNYTLSYIGAKLTTATRAVEVTADAQSKTYGDADPILKYKITKGSLAFSDAFTGSLTRVAGENVGTYAINQGTLALSANYALTFVGANLTIGKRSVTVTADAKSKVFGQQPDPALTYQVTAGSLVNGDSFGGALTRVTGEAVGSYAILQGTLSLSSNYVLTYVGANLTINAADTSVTLASSSLYSPTVNTYYSALNQPVAFTATVTTKAPGSGTPVGSVTFTDGSTTLATVALDGSGKASFTTASLAVGSHTIVATFNPGSTNFNTTTGSLKQVVQFVVGGTTCVGGPSRTILQPINADGTSVWKARNVVPVKFRVCDANGNSIGGTIAAVFDTSLTGGVAAPYQYKATNGQLAVDEVAVSNTPDTQFRWDSSAQQWIFNLNTNNLTSNNIYFYHIYLADGTTVDFTFGLK